MENNCLFISVYLIPEKLLNNFISVHWKSFSCLRTFNSTSSEQLSRSLVIMTIEIMTNRQWFSSYRKVGGLLLIR